MLGQVAITGVDIRFVTVRLGDAAAQIVGHQYLCSTAEKSKTAGVGAQPVGMFLRPGGFGKGVARRSQHGNEDLSLADLAGSPVDDRRGLSSCIDEQLFASSMLLAH